jgi:hypothetical protein
MRKMTVPIASAAAAALIEWAYKGGKNPAW